MNQINNYSKDCYDLSEANDQYVKQWTDNKTTDTIIKVAPLAFAPYLVYTELNETHYQWCGPMLMIAQFFARISNTK